MRRYRLAARGRPGTLVPMDEAMTPFLQGDATYLREVSDLLKKHGIPVATGPLPSG
ncbi:MAG: hypothetical protein Fur0037_28360 [Planctomycetota bacterium]